MNGLLEYFEIKDLYIVKFKRELINTVGLEYNEFINYFKPEFYYIVERFHDENNNKHFETYKECIAGEDFYKRESYEDFNKIAECISAVRKLCPKMLCGAGTVINPKLAKLAKKSGAQFVMAPGFNPGLFIMVSGILSIPSKS